MTWNPEWGGETVFYEDNGRDILESSPYTPNRAIIFDGSIKHTIKAQNILGPSYRFTTSLFFHK
jgi:SM-20-related protein